VGLRLDAPGESEPVIGVRQSIDGQVVGGSVYRPPDEVLSFYLPMLLRSAD
jgi:hypothetical protein